MANKYLALQKDVFDISKVTVVGSPTITSDGVASGFSDGNRILLPNAINFTSDWELRFSFICTNTLVNERIVGSSISGNARLGINIGFTGAVNEENKLMCWLSSGTLSTDAWDIINRKASTTTFQTNQLYYIILQCKNGVYSLKSSTDNINWVTEWTVNSSLVAGTKNLALGCPIAEPNFYFLGSIDLPSFKIYVDNQLVFQPVKPTYLIERRKPKVWNKGQFTIVGDVAISDEGVANLIRGDAIYSNIHISNGTETIIEFDYTYKPSSTVQLLWIAYPSETDHTELYWTYVYLDGRVASNNTTSVKALSENVKYHFKIKTDFATYNETYVNGELWSKSTEQKTYDVGQIYFANRYDKIRPVVSPFALKSIKITSNNTLVFDGGAETYVYDPSKFTIVGSPTITEYGVASGFGASDYVTSNYNLEENKTYTFVVEGIGGVPRTDRGSYIFSAFYNSVGSDNLRVITGVNNGIVRFALGGVMGDVSTTFAISDGVKYKIELKTDFKSFVTFTDLLTGYTLTKTGYTITNQTYGNKVITYGTNKGEAPLTNVSINLPSISITVDNKEVFTGAKENYYMLNGI